MGKNSGTKGGWSSNGNGTKSKTYTEKSNPKGDSGDMQSNKLTRKDGVGDKKEHTYSGHNIRTGRTYEGGHGEDHKK